MEIGQTYKIPIPYYFADSETERHKAGTGILIQETPYLLVFEYKDRHKNVCRTSFRKSDWIQMHKRKGTTVI